MYECVAVSDRCSYMNCPARVGFVDLGDGTLAAIDGGSDKDAGKKILRIVEDKGLRLRAVYCTHSHADHTGGVRLLRERTGCSAYLPPAEQAWGILPRLSTVFLFGGFPPKDLDHKFLVAQPFDALPLTDDVLPDGLTALPLWGHSPRMTGFRFEDGTVFLGDTLCSPETLAKYPVTFLWDVGEHRRTLERVAGMEGSVFVSAHAEPLEDVRPLVQINLDAIDAVAATVESLCREPATPEQVTEGVFAAYDIRPNPVQNTLVGSTVRSYLSWLRNEDRLTVSCDRGLTWFQTV